MYNGWVNHQPEVQSTRTREGERVNLKINQIPAITFLEGNLPRTMLDELNAHVDEHREKDDRLLW